MASIKEKSRYKKKQWLKKRFVLAAVGTVALANLGPAAKYAMATTTVPPLVDVNFYDSSASSPYSNATGPAVIGAKSTFVQGNNYVLLTPMSSSTGTLTINQTLQTGASVVSRK